MRIWTLFLLLVFIPACAGDRPVLRVGTSGDYAPFSLDGKGFDIDVAELMAADLGMRVDWVPFRWPDLERAVGAGEFDVAMSGVTWRPERAVHGYMTLAVAAGGPCILGEADHPARVAVNQGGFLEGWARNWFGDETEIVTTDDNRALPALLERGDVQAIVTDSFELPHFRVDGEEEWCSPPLHRKVYWVTDADSTLGLQMDAWLLAHEPRLRELRTRWFGTPQPREPADHVVDIVARRFALMPAVAAYKAEHGLAIEDLAREEAVLAAVAAFGPRTVALFEALIDRSKRIQKEGRPAPRLDLETELRPAILRLGGRLDEVLARAVPLEPAQATEARLALLPGTRADRLELWGLLAGAGTERP